MIEWLSKDERRILLTYSHREENRLKQLYPEYANRIVDWESYVRSVKSGGSFFAREKHKVGVDNADYLLEKVLGTFVDKATFNIDAPIELRETPDTKNT